MKMKDPRACYECGRQNPTPKHRKVIKECDDETQICYYITVKVHEECL